MSEPESLPDQYYRIATLARKIDVRPVTLKKYLAQYGIEILSTPVGQRVTQTEWARFVNLFYGSSSAKETKS